ncbi:MAG: heparinase II/III family protein [Gemmatimonadales bacterium]
MHRLAETLVARRAELERIALLQDLAAHLRRNLEPLLRRKLYLPDQKPLLSRDGGTCPSDGARLTFDPFSPEVHRCARCGGEFTGERHHLAWIWRYHLWLSERAVHLALLHGLIRDEAYARLAREIIAGYAGLYSRLPNSDNVLGPSRLFFSTYLESIWLVQTVLAARLLAEGGASDGWRESFSRMVGESIDLISSFDEAWSNRQVWNNAALLAAADWLDDGSLRDSALEAPHGIGAQLRRCVTSEGLWFEGENYHFFALRGLLLAAELASAAGCDLYGDENTGTVLRAMYVAPLDTVLPDLSLPARADAPYGTSIRQPALAELWEVGWARTGDPRIEELLADLYARDGPAPGPRIGEIVEQQERAAPVKLSRGRLGWKALLWMRCDTPVAPVVRRKRPRARLMASSGIVVLRNERGAHASIECGGAPGGHGHPDLLHLSLYWGAPVLLDFGTGSYVSPSLRWYRSTLAHNAPCAPGAGQLARHGSCRALDEKGDWSWCRAAARDVFGSGTSATRTLVLGPRYLVDVVELDVPESMVVDLPIHPLDEVGTTAGAGATAAAQTLLPPDVMPLGHEHGYDAVRDVRIVEASALKTAPVRLVPREGETLYVARAPGPPDRWYAEGSPLAFLVRRAQGGGTWFQLYDPKAHVSAVRLEGRDVVVRLAGGGEERLTVGRTSARIVDAKGRTHRLSGGRPQRREPTQGTPPPVVLRCPVLKELPGVSDWQDTVPRWAVIELDGRHYRRSERGYGERGPFLARVAVSVVDERVVFAVDVEKTDLCFRAVDAADPALDNETPDVNSDGVECFFGVRRWEGYLVVPVPGKREARVSGAVGSAADPKRVAAQWCETSRGYRMLVTIEAGRTFVKGDRFRANLVVNEMYPERVRRAGQLVLSGDAGWVYLRGDRESAELAPVMEVV